MITITDRNSDQAATVDAHDIADTLHPWFTDAPAEVTEAIDDLQGAVLTRDHKAFELAEYLGLDIAGV